MKEVRHTVRVRCPATHAFEVFTRQVDAWWPPTHRRIAGSTLELTPGPEGALQERGPDGTVLEIGRVLDWDPPAALSFAWRLGAPPDAPTSVRITFTPEVDATRVDVVHVDGPRPLPDWASTAPRFVQGWTHVLAALQAHLESA